MSEQPLSPVSQESTDAMVTEFPTAWQRAFLPLRILTELSKGPNHGYAVAVALEGLGFSRVKGATLYPALAKLEENGFLSTTWEEGHGGPGRKVYKLTGEGGDELRRLDGAWLAFRSAISSH